MGAVIRYKNLYSIRIGNKKITRVKSEYFKLSNLHPTLKINTDHTSIDITNKFKAAIKQNFMIVVPKNIRVNVIGFTSKKYKNEANIWIKLKDINKRYSIYKDKPAFRVEFYDSKNSYIKTVIIEL